MPEAELRALRGTGISYIFQDPLSALNPVRRCGEQVAEVIRIHEPSRGHDYAEARVIELFERLGLPRAKETMRKYPHELSGGMRQRVMIAMALACKPALLIADEPTTALDVIVQRQIVELLRETIADLGTSLLFISHDLALVSSITQQIIVMRNGEIVETGDTSQVWQSPTHPYTKQLWRRRQPSELRRGRPCRRGGRMTAPHRQIFCGWTVSRIRFSTARGGRSVRWRSTMSASPLERVRPSVSWESPAVESLRWHAVLSECCRRTRAASSSTGTNSTQAGRRVGGRFGATSRWCSRIPMPRSIRG